MDQNKIGRFIAKKRKEHDLTQVQLAEKLGVSNKSVSKWERGVCMPEVALYQELCKVLGITINELFAGEELEKTDVETKSEETIMSIAQDGSNKEKKLRSRIIALVVVVCLLAAGFIYAYSKWKKEEVVPTNYIRTYTYTEDGETVKNMMEDGESEFRLLQYDVDNTYKKATLVVEKYRGNELVATYNHIEFDELRPGGGLISGAFNQLNDSYDLKIADKGHSMGSKGSGITNDEKYDANSWGWSMQMMGEESIDIKKGEAIPLFVVYVTKSGRTCSYGPDKVEGLAREGNLDFVDYTMVVKVIFE